MATNKSRPDIINITDIALTKIKSMISLRTKPTIGIKISIKTKGCSGLSYNIEYADSYESKDQIIEKNGIKIIIDPKAILFLIGSTMDFKEEKFKSGFVFENPQERGRCGCGESFHI